MNRPVICRYCGTTIGHSNRVNTRETMHVIHLPRCPASPLKRSNH